MTTGTVLIQDAARMINAHSSSTELDPEEFEVGRRLLNGMRSAWLDREIDVGAATLNAVGDEFSEPLSTTNAFVFNLAIAMAPMFAGAGSRVSKELQNNANVYFGHVKDNFQTISTPKKKASALLPMGEGNQRSVDFRIFAGTDNQISDNSTT